MSNGKPIIDNYHNPNKTLSPNEFEKDRKKIKLSQRAKILTLLDRGCYINRPIAFKLGIYELGARVHELRKSGLELATVWVRGETCARIYSRAGERNIPIEDVRLVTWYDRVN